MNYTGVIIEESLKDKAVLSQVKVTKTKVEPVTEHHKTPWLKQWTLHTFEISEDQAALVAEQLSKSLDNNYWYADFKNNDYHFVIFPNKVFKVDRSKPKQYEPVVKHGLSLGIPDYQLDFSPAIKQWERPKE
ncbi:hypothetical protein A3E76_02575 [Candidatus Saccharibacteria bacterium RIFCSPHIGHO2_12_FULL_44_22]|nr:MAG: hypothetical protein A3E76_02575 [Candidatus Saccharibacteria bacterium RIFCSPHIGHO2_12_FULL_44_22]